MHIRIILALLTFLFVQSAMASFVGHIGTGTSGVFGIDPDSYVGAVTGINGGGSPPAGCSGVIDLSNGCPQPMIGVM